MASALKLMIVDDERDVESLYRQRFRRELREGKVDFVFAFSGEEALEKIRALSPLDVMMILSDINMPGMTGLELLRLVKSEFPQLKVCMITAYNDEKNFETAKKYGADKYLTKPIDFEQLRKEILTIQ